MWEEQSKLSSGRVKLLFLGAGGMRDESGRCGWHERERHRGGDKHGQALVDSARQDGAFKA